MDHDEQDDQQDSNDDQPDHNDYQWDPNDGQQVNVKGKGAMITYWLVGEEPALRAARFSSDQKDFDDGCHYLV